MARRRRDRLSLERRGLFGAGWHWRSCRKS